MKKTGTTIQYHFQAWRFVTSREAELLCRVMQRAAREQLREWDELDAEKHAVKSAVDWVRAVKP